MSEFRTPVATNGRLIVDADEVVIAVSVVYGNEIVRRVNSHEALVKALKDLIGAINLDHPDAHEAVAFAEAYARAALAAAGAPQ